MKTATGQTFKQFCFGLITAIVLLTSVSSLAQVNHLKDFTQHKYAYENLVNAIKSLNDGVREDAIYLVGKYRFVDFENELLSQLDREKKSDIKVLIGLALFRLESEKGMQKMLELSTNDKNDKVRRISRAIYNEFITGNSNRTVSR